MAWSRLDCVFVPIFMIAFLLQAVFSMWDDAPTYDEIIAPAVGYAELITGDFTLVSDHPPLYRTLIALPLLAFQPLLPLDHGSWQKRQRGMEDRYDFAWQFFYGVNHNADGMLFWSRVPIVLLSLLLGLLVFQWAKELYGNFAGLFALFLYCFEPNIIAHSRFTTNDLILTLFLFSTIYQFWRYCHEPSLKSLVLTGTVVGLSLLLKFSAIMLFPMLFLLVFLGSKILNDPSSTSIITQKKRLIGFLGRAMTTLSLASIIAVGVVLLFYRAQWKLFFVGVYNAVTHYRGGHPGFLLGDYSATGWWYYFPVVVFLKTPISLMIFLLVSFLFLSFRKRKAEYFLLIPVCVIGLSALSGHINIGLRHILPIYPFLVVVASSVVTIRFSRPRFFFTCLAALALWYIASTLSIYPSYLAYFNEFVVRGQGYRMLVDSNLDWGQDLKRLKMFMNEKGIKRIYLSYFGTASPCYYEINFIPLPGFASGCGQKTSHGSADFIAISATNLQSVYLPEKKSFEWLKGYRPVAQIGYSIFIYNIKGDAYAHNDLGFVYLKYKMHEQALDEFKVVTELAPKEAIAHANLGFIYNLTSHHKEAEEEFRTALKLDPANVWARRGLETAKKSGGR